jgi:hypothetical protein
MSIRFLAAQSLFFYFPILYIQKIGILIEDLTLGWYANQLTGVYFTLKFLFGIRWIALTKVIGV